MLSDAYTTLDSVYRTEWGRILATLIRLFGDFDVAEEAAQEAFTAAIDQWQTDGVPDSPRAWIIRTASHKAVDRIRRQARLREKLESLAYTGTTVEEPALETDEIPDDRLRLIF